MSKTPRTDSNIIVKDIMDDGGGDCYPIVVGQSQSIKIEFARQLERELSTTVPASVVKDLLDSAQHVINGKETLLRAYRLGTHRGVESALDKLNKWLPKYKAASSFVGELLSKE